jgi:N-acetylglutamate synthase-like GNAT family acetyltransferase
MVEPAATDPWTLRPTRADDLAVAERLLADAGLPCEGVAARFDTAYVLADSAGGVVGVAGVEVHGRLGLLRSVAVAGHLQGTGIGQALVADRLRWATEQGLEALYLLTLDAAGYFTRFGFRPVDRERVPDQIRRSSEFESLCPDTAAVMVRNLD